MEYFTPATGSQPTPSFLQSMAGMFGKGYPEGVNPELVAKAMTVWKNYWFFPADMATVIALFCLFFLARQHQARRV